MSGSLHSPASQASGSHARTPWLVFLALWLTLLIFGAITAPVPAVNEPHYLGKAKHFWDPAWCAGDLLLESSNAHAVFYFVFGYWAQWLSLPQLAWLGRILGYGLLAWGWWRTHEVLGLVRWRSWWSLLGFLALATWGNLSGEWLVGGIEGKVLAYSFLLLAFADWQLGRLVLAALWSGLAISFHPLAGGWAVLAAMLASLPGLQTQPKSWRTVAASAIVLILAALPGVIPVLQLLLSQDSDDIRFQGTYLQVYYRLAHHLDPMTFSWRSWAGYAALIAIIITTRRTWQDSAAGRRWQGMLVWAGLFAFAGLLAGFGPRPAAQMPYYHLRMQLLKFYPFRLFDVFVPLTVSMACTGLVAHWWEQRAPQLRTRSCIALGLVLLSGLAGGQFFRQSLQSPTVFDTLAWLDVCHWVRDHAPPHALIQSPTNNPNFKWHAQRAEYVTIKDIPQDSRSIVEWNRRLLFLGKWYQVQREDGLYDNHELRALREETGITHILTDRLGPFELPPCYTNDRFRVYDLTELDQNVE